MSVFPSARTHFVRAVVVLAALGSAISQAYAQTTAEVQLSIKAAKKGDNEPISRLKERYGNKALVLYSAARFDSDPMVRMGVLSAAGKSLDSLLFTLPLIEDDDRSIASAAMTKLTWIAYYDPETLARLRMEQVVPPLLTAVRKHPEILRSNHYSDEVPRLMLFLVRYKEDPAVRSLLGRVLKENGWNGFFAGNTPTEWEDNSIAALITQCEMGRLNPSQVITVFEADPKTRPKLLHYVEYVRNKSLLRYAVSLLYDKTKVAGLVSDDSLMSVSVYAWSMLGFKTKINIKWIEVDGVLQYENGVPLYDKDGVAKLYAYYGLTEK